MAALVIGVGAGYLARSPAVPDIAPKPAFIAPKPAAVNPAVAAISARIEGEPVIELRLDRGLESLSRIRPPTESAVKEP